MSWIRRTISSVDLILGEFQHEYSTLSMTLQSLLSSSLKTLDSSETFSLKLLKILASDSAVKVLKWTRSNSEEADTGKIFFPTLWSVWPLKNVVLISEIFLSTLLRSRESKWVASTSKGTFEACEILTFPKHLKVASLP